MLILTRKPGEMIRVGPDIEVTVLGVRGAQVRIGIKAPASVKVLREEVEDHDVVVTPAQRVSGV